MDIMFEMRKHLDKEIEKTILSQFPQLDETPKQVDFVEEIRKMQDKLTTVILCNPDESERLIKEAENVNGFYEIIDCAYIEKGKAIIVMDEKLKLSFLSAKRNNGTTPTPTHATID